MEQDLLRQLEVPSFESIQLPGGCSSLLSILAQQNELAAALSGHEDALDVGPLLYEDVMVVIKKAVANLQHSAQARRGQSVDGEVLGGMGVERRGCHAPWTWRLSPMTVDPMPLVIKTLLCYSLSHTSGLMVVCE